VVKAALLLVLLSMAYGCESRAVHPCQASQLRASQGRVGVGLGNRLEEVVFTNMSRQACSLHGYPTITAGGRVVPVRRGGTYFGRLVPAVLEPGTRGFLDFGTADLTDCPIGPSTVRYHDLVFTLPRGGGRLRSKIVITEHCSLSISELGRPEPPG
jgi:Protein of unknown function (DUF4232)